MTKRCPNILHLTDAELRMVSDGVEILQPDHDARPMQVSILERIWKLQGGQHFINEGGGYFKAACETDDCPNPSQSGSRFCSACDTSAQHVCEVKGCERIPEAGSICNECAPGAVADPAAMRLVIAAEAMLNSFGGDVPDWLRTEAAELGKALEPYSNAQEEPAEVSTEIGTFDVVDHVGIGLARVRRDAQNIAAGMEQMRAASNYAGSGDVELIDKRVDEIMRSLEYLAGAVDRLAETVEGQR